MRGHSPRVHTCLSAWLCVWLCVCRLAVCLCVYVLVCLCACMPVWLCGSVALWLCVPLCLCVSLSLCLWVAYVYVFVGRGRYLDGSPILIAAPSAVSVLDSFFLCSGVNESAALWPQIVIDTTRTGGTVSAQ